MASGTGPQRIVVLCTVGEGVDTVTELARRGITPAALVGLHPNAVDPDQVSGWIDIAPVAARLGAEAVYVRTYGLKDQADRAAVKDLQPDLVLVTGWQRLVPEWLIDLAPLGVLGVHGSSDGIHGGRGRSPQNWALLLGCRSFDLSLFRITPGIDDGPVLATRSFSYSDEDDIRISKFRTSLAMAEMVEEVFRSPERLRQGDPQPQDAFYYPQRKPEDGWVDWTLTRAEIARHCRALTRPYPGLRTQAGEIPVRIWRCVPFDDDVQAEPATVSSCFAAGEFLVHAIDGRVLVRDWSADGDWWPRAGDRLEGRSWSQQLAEIVTRHERKFPDLPVTARIRRRLRVKTPITEAGQCR